MAVVLLGGGHQRAHARHAPAGLGALLGKDVKIGYTTINAKAETVAEKPALFRPREMGFGICSRNIYKHCSEDRRWYNALSAMGR